MPQASGRADRIDLGPVYYSPLYEVFSPYSVHHQKISSWEVFRRNAVEQRSNLDEGVLRRWNSPAATHFPAADSQNNRHEEAQPGEIPLLLTGFAGSHSELVNR